MKALGFTCCAGERRNRICYVRKEMTPMQPAPAAQDVEGLVNVHIAQAHLQGLILQHVLFQKAK